MKDKKLEFKCRLTREKRESVFLEIRPLAIYPFDYWHDIFVEIDTFSGIFYRNN